MDHQCVRSESDDPFLRIYEPSELRTAAKFLSIWKPFLSKRLCSHCTLILSDRIRSIHPEFDDEYDDHREKNDMPEPAPQICTSECKSRSIETSSQRMSWADMAQEEDMERESNHNSCNPNSVVKTAAEKPKLSREQREYIRFMNVMRKKDFEFFETVHGKPLNILEGLQLHAPVFSAAEQKRILNYVASLLDMAQRGQFKGRTNSAPQKWMRGKGRQTLQFGCCYNYAMDEDGNPPGILHEEEIDPIPDLFKVMIRRLIKWHVLPPTCVPDSCIVNIYEEGECIPPHIDNHDFIRPFCTVSFLSECKMVFGSNLKIVGPGEYDGPVAIPLPVGSVLVLNGNAANVAKHCVPPVPAKRISITFRRMDVSKRPTRYVPEPDLQGIQPLAYEVDPEKRPNGSKPNGYDRNDKNLEAYEMTRSLQWPANREQ
ncbi:RNA demethylase ALKBH9B-like [Senna tora]|uniref:RNA demethylase ALKBH9B-like n=1 Tax=Senna tora TaxID=362788 RepID=A0A834TXI8_9FABA|nr:RNA demethylase ALKBH9B-like [Senna tora]